MHIYFIIFAVVVIISWIVIGTIRPKNKSNNENDINNKDVMENEEIEMENIFSDEVKKGEKPFKLMDVYDQIDVMLLKSLFQSEQIPYKIEFEHGSRIYAGSSIIETAVFILEKDREDAIKILEEYDKAKLKNIEINDQ
jgi:hypothetical protein